MYIDDLLIFFLLAIGIGLFLTGLLFIIRLISNKVASKERE